MLQRSRQGGPARSPSPPKRHASHTKDLSSVPFLPSADDLFSIIGSRSPIRASLPSPASLAPSSVPSILGLGEGSPHCKQAFSHSGGCGLAGGTESWAPTPQSTNGTNDASWACLQAWSRCGEAAEDAPVATATPSESCTEYCTSEAALRDAAVILRNGPSFGL
jgi:hypothetical protein